MDTREFEEIKKKIGIGKEKRAKADGAIENLLSTWAKQYSIKSAEEAQERLESLQEEYDRNNAKIDLWYDELKGLCNWGLV